MDRTIAQWPQVVQYHSASSGLSGELLIRVSTVSSAQRDGAARHPVWLRMMLSAIIQPHVEGTHVGEGEVLSWKHSVPDFVTLLFFFRGAFARTGLARSNKSAKDRGLKKEYLEMPLVRLTQNSQN